MSWNWIKINNLKDLPAFGRPVLLYQKKKDGKEYATVGELKSVDASGYHWGTGLTGGVFDFNSIFGNQISEDFQPSHWCDVDRPKEEPKVGLINFGQLAHGMNVKVVFLDDENDNIKTEETGTVEFVNHEKKTFILRHDQKESSIRGISSWEELYKLKRK